VSQFKNPARNGNKAATRFFSLAKQRLLSPLRLPFRHIGVQANVTRGLAQTKRFSICDQLP